MDLHNLALSFNGDLCGSKLREAVGLQLGPWEKLKYIEALAKQEKAYIYSVVYLETV